MRELVDRARRGDHDAFAALVDASVDRLYAAATLILRDADRARDAVQEASIAAWRDIRGLRDPDRFDAWLHRLLVRACYRQLRDARRRQIVELRILQDWQPALPGHELAIANRDRLERGFARLAPDHRAILVLYHYLDLPLDAVAEALRIPLGTAKSRLTRATAAMRAAIEADDRAGTLAEGRSA